MRYDTTKKFLKLSRMMALVTASAVFMAGCGQTGNRNTEETQNTAGDNRSEAAATGSTGISDEPENTVSTEPEASAEIGTSAEKMNSAAELVVRFGDGGSSFTMHLYDNDTAAAIARHVGTADWRLPIYHYDDYDGWEYMQYYDIPSRYEIPDNPEEITSVLAGEVYYSKPNRIVLFYQDAEIESTQYSKVGYFDATEEFVTAVVENPVLEGWGNKIVNISDGN